MKTITQVAVECANKAYSTINQNNAASEATAAATELLAEGGWKWIGLPSYALRDGNFTFDRVHDVFVAAFVAEVKRLSMSNHRELSSVVWIKQKALS